MKYIKSITERLNSINEKLSGSVYHYTSAWNLEKILKDNNVHLSSSLANSGNNSIHAYKDKKRYGQGMHFDKIFYLSLTRAKSPKVGYARNNTQGGRFIVRIDFNGDSLNNNFKTYPVDYWQRKDMVDINKASIFSDNDKLHRILSDYEYEERIVSKDDKIKNISKYINKIDIFIDTVEYEKKYYDVLRNILEYASKIDVKVFIYDDIKNFNLTNGNIINDDILNNHQFTQTDNDNKNRAYNGIETEKILTILVYDRKIFKSDNAYEQFKIEAEKIIKKYNLIYDLDKNYYNLYHRITSLMYGGSHYTDYISGLSADIHNSQGKGYNQALKILTDYMHKHKFKTIRDVINYKVEGAIPITNIKYDMEIYYEDKEWNEHIIIDNDKPIQDVRRFYITSISLGNDDKNEIFGEFYLKNKTIGEFFNYLLNRYTKERFFEFVSEMSEDAIKVKLK